MRFAKGNTELWLDKQFPIGTQVEIETSSYALAIGTSITLGIPLVAAGTSYYLSGSWILTLGAVLLSAILVLMCCRTEKFRLLLVPRVRNVV
jgi:hypothetical protein